MPVPLSQMWTVAGYVLGKKLRGVERYPLVLMLEPLFRCNLACAGCGKIQHPTETLRRHLTPQQCFDAVEECGAPMVSIPGGEPLLHPNIDEIVAGLVARKKYVYLCTNAILLEKHLDKFTPSKYLSFSVHIDGLREEHDEAVCREGVYDVAVSAIRAAVARGFRVTTNTTLFNTADPERVREMFDGLMELGVEGMMVSPGYPYEKAPDQEHFLHREETKSLFRRILAPQQQPVNGERGIANCKLGIANCKLGFANLQFAFRNLQFAISRAITTLHSPETTHHSTSHHSTTHHSPLTTQQKKKWRFNQSPLFLEFLRGNFDLECTPWGNPTYNLFGWQRPCYLMNEGYAATFQELMETTDWSKYGCASGNPKCTDCMVHSGYEPSAVQATFGSLQGLLTAARVTLFGPGKDDERPSPPIPASHRPRHREPDVVPLETTLRSA